jgi:beta-galactosidase
MFISEYGAGSDNSLNSDKPERFDFTGQYQRIFSESFLKQIEERDFISGSAIWNQFDFSQPDVGGSIPHVNQKGMATWDRKPKDVYYLFQANWSKKPMVRIAEHDWPVRAIYGNSKTYVFTIYSNLKEITLYNNGKKIKTKAIGALHKVEFDVSLSNGINNLVAIGTEKGNTIQDFCPITVQSFDPQHNPNISINLGSNTQYLDYDANVSYIEDQLFNGAYGYAGGIQKQLNKNYIMLSGLHNGLFYSALEGVENYKIKVKNGNYKLTLYFMEQEKIDVGERVFDVIVNGQKEISRLDLTKEAGFCFGIEKIITISVINGEVKIDFISTTGKSIISGLQLQAIE